MAKTQTSIKFFFAPSKRLSGNGDLSELSVAEDASVSKRVCTETTESTEEPCVSGTFSPTDCSSKQFISVDFDIANAVGTFLTDHRKRQFLESCWVPAKDYEFPKKWEGGDNGAMRAFSYQYFAQYAPWLAYSEKHQGAYCKFCVIFAVDKPRQRLHQLVRSPLQKYKKAVEKFDNHAITEYHQDAMDLGTTFLRNIADPSRNIQAVISEKYSKAQDVARSGVLSVAKAVLMCGRQGLAFRGHRDNIVVAPNTDYFGGNSLRYGNFNALLLLQLSSGDTALRRHLEESGRNAKFVTAECQNEMISIAGKIIQEKLIARVQRAEFFAVLADGTTDVYKTDQFSLAVRYYLDGTLHEDFLEFVDVSGETTGEELAGTILARLKSFGLDLNKLRGQGYDGAANMTGIIKGVKTRVLEQYPKALFTHCGAHVLNLALADACNLIDMKNMFGTVNEIGNFFDSANRMKQLEEFVPPDHKGVRPQLMCPTRWSTRFVSLENFWILLKPITESLEHFMTTADSKTSGKANCFLGATTNFSFLVCLAVARYYFRETNTLSTFLQGEQVDFVDAMAEVNTVITVLKDHRANVDTVFTELYANVIALADQIQIDETTPRITGRQRNRANVVTACPEQHYRVNVAIPFLDYLINSLDEHFSEATQRALKISRLLPRAIGEQTIDLDDTLDMYKDDMPSPYLVESELRRWKADWIQIDANDRPKNIVDTLSSDKITLRTNLMVLLKIFAVLPVSVVECERSFSTLRRLKTYMRSTMGQERLVGLALMAVHRDVVVSPVELRDRFMCARNRRLLG